MEHKDDTACQIRKTEDDLDVEEAAGNDHAHLDDLDRSLGDRRFKDCAKKDLCALDRREERADRKESQSKDAAVLAEGAEVVLKRKSRERISALSRLSDAREEDQETGQ